MPETKWVLVAEDDDNDFGLIQRSVNKLGLELELRRGVNGAEALRVLKESATQPVFVLLDVKMPKVSGLEVLQAVRSEPKTKYLPAIMLTSSDETADMLEAYKLGCNAYLRKPISYTEFIDIIRCTVIFWLQVRLPHEG